MEARTTKSVIPYSLSGKTAIIHWLPVVLFMVTASLIRLRSNAAVDYYLLAGSDGPYDPLQVRSMLEHFHLAMPDMPLLFVVEGLLARALQILHIASPEACILLSIKVTNSFLPPLAATPVFLIAKEFIRNPSINTSLPSYLIVAFSILNFTPLLLFSNSVLQKNAVAMIWVFFYLYFVSRFSEENRKANQALVDVLGKMARERNATAAQMALAWLLAQKPWIVPIPGTTKLHRLEENIGSVDIVLTSGDLKEIGDAVAEIEVQGARYPEKMQKMINR